MTIATQKYLRKPFTVDAVRVTAENIEQVAKWCNGEIKEGKRGPNTEKYVSVPVAKPLNERQTMAFKGDWVLFSAGSFKVYTNRAFEQSFEPYMHTVEVAGQEALDGLAAKFKPGQS